MDSAAPTALDRPHSTEPQAVLAALGASAAGLTTADAEERLGRIGPNRLPSPPKTPAILRFLKHFDDVLIYILLAAGALKAILGDWIDFAVIMVVAVANAVVGFLQEGRAEHALAGLATMLSLDAQARRDGAWSVVPAEQLVPGDIVRLRSGDRVPADLRLIEATGLQVEEAALTGESVAAAKTVDAADADAGIGDRTSMVYSGTIVTAGRAVGVVTATGAQTEIGRIQSMVAGVEHIETPLTQQLGRLGKQLSLLILGMAFVMLVIGRLIHGFPPADLISAAIGFAVAAVPEGLPALVTVTLALGVQQMARRNAITRKITAVETLGAVTTICSDKTGTLTKNEMTARTVVTTAGEYDIEGLGYAPNGRMRLGETLVTADDRPDLARLLQTAAACNDARIVQQNGGWQLVGQPTEGALAALAMKAGLTVGGHADRVAAIPFESVNKFSATLDRTAAGLRIRLVGAPDRLLDRCTTELAPDGTVRPLDVAAWERVIDELGSQGLRVLATADGDGAGRTQLEVSDVDTGLTFLGLIGIVDPPRPEAIDAIALCRGAGIGVTMITGDHAGTALAIAREMDIVDSTAAPVLTGAELEAMTDSELRERVQGVHVYARTSPEHKIRIVRALQAHREVVAMTGDGVNDAPALTRADVGIAMGIKGTEATKEAAEIVLADDNFASIERAVEEGRRIYDNIRKSVVFLLPTNGAQSLVVLVAVLFGFTLPLEPVQILWINLVTAVTLSLALAGEPAEPGIMHRRPRPPGEHVLAGRSLVLVLVASLLIGGATIAVYVLDIASGAAVDAAQTAAVTMLALGQLAFLLNCRFLNTSSLTTRVLTGNRLVWISAGVLLVLQLLFAYTPFMNAWFGSAPITVREWALTIGFAAAVFAAVEGVKALTRVTDRLVRPSAIRVGAR